VKNARVQNDEHRVDAALRACGGKLSVYSIAAAVGDDRLVRIVPIT